MISMGLSRRLTKDGGNCDMKQKKMCPCQTDTSPTGSRMLAKCQIHVSPFCQRFFATLMMNLDGSGFEILVSATATVRDLGFVVWGSVV